jgi:two-component system, chemotaxis family, chemotaxis protein CheY
LTEGVQWAQPSANGCKTVDAGGEEITDRAGAMRLVLVVDDEEDVRPLFLQRFRRQISRNEVNLEFASSGHEALEKLSEFGADVVLILSDIRMPGMDGFELLSNIRGQWPVMPVYLVTAYHAQEYRSRAIELGATGYFTKPVDFDELRSLITPSGAPAEPAT